MFNKMCQKFWLPQATVANFLQHSEVTGRAERGRGLRQGMFVGAAIAQKERGGRLDAPTCNLLQIPDFRQSAALPTVFKTAASCCWQLLPERAREKMHQQTAFLESFIVPSHYMSNVDTNPRSI